MNSFGNKFRISIFGESHGPAVGIIIDGVRPGTELGADDFLPDMARRKSGSFGTTSRKENDAPEILSGVYNGFATGSPIALIIRNEDAVSQDYSDVKNHPRPSHADMVATQKYGGFNDPRGGGHFSGRMTAPLVAAGVVAKKVLGADIYMAAEITEMGGVADKARFDEVLNEAVKAQDSIGGIVECVVDGIPAGWGEPFFDSVESVIAHLLLSIPGIRGVEFGAGFEAARMKGTKHNDPIADSAGRTLSNNAGGINGGIANGNRIVVRVAVKPTASIGKAQNTFNLGTGSMETLAIKGRHDACIALRMPVIVEAAVAIALAQFA